MISSEQLGFRALADPTRRNILMLLGEEDLTIAEVAENFDMTRAAVKKHLAILAEGELIVVKTVGRSRENSLNSEGLKRLFDWFGFFDSFWDTRLDALKNEIEKDMQ